MVRGLFCARKRAGSARAGEARGFEARPRFLELVRRAVFFDAISGGTPPFARPKCGYQRETGGRTPEEVKNNRRAVPQGSRQLRRLSVFCAGRRKMSQNFSFCDTENKQRRYSLSAASIIAVKENKCNHTGNDYIKNVYQNDLKVYCQTRLKENRRKNR